ncbi:helix-turn-helix domain-containing protein [Pseudonocardia spirodelae]|uniref:Helix-turn-helix domain-containing protein n=1 Tax=Pseudonocardia spirodelae TaxID=3133431 RepID=A0ABU8T133_9PSEU
MSAEYVPARPPAALRGHVLRYLGYREHSPDPVRRRQPPAAGVALILGAHPIALSGPGVGTASATAFAGGLGDTWVLTEFTGPQAGVQVDLTPAAAFTLLGGRALPGGAVPRLDELDDTALAALPDRLAAAPTWSHRFALVTDLLATRLLDARARRPDPEVLHAWSRFEASGGTVPVGVVAAETGWSRRHLQDRFRTQTGIAPVTARRVLRFGRAAALVGAGTPLAGVAAGCGYTDQAHLTREFRALAGITPGAFRAERAAGFPSVQDLTPPTGQDRAS